MFTVNLKPKWFHLTPDVTYPIDYSPEGQSYFVFEDGEVCIRDSYYTHGVNGYRKKNDQQLSVALSKAILTVLGYAETLNKTTFISLSMELYRSISFYLRHYGNEQETFNIRGSFDGILAADYRFNESEVVQLSSNYYYICQSFKKQYLKGFTSDNYEDLKKLDMLPDYGKSHICTPPSTHTEINNAQTLMGHSINVPVDENVMMESKA